MTPSIKTVFYGTPDLCLPILDRLDAAGFTPGLIITAPDRPVGRKQTITPPPVKTWGLEHNIPVLQPEQLDDSTYQALAEFAPDVAIVVAYGQIMPERFINLPEHGTLNIHYSILPRWRGASPVEATILAGDTETGVSIQQMVYALDAGPVVADAKIELHGDETAPELKEVLSEIGADLLVDALPPYLNDEITLREQDPAEVTTCTKIKKSDGEVTLDMDPAELWRRYRAYDGWPGIFYFDTDGTRIKITEATFSRENQQFSITKVIPEGKPEREVLIPIPRN